MAILVYARTAGRMGEIAIRTALGASRARIVAQLFAEALALAGVAALAGLGIAYVALRNIDAVLARIQGEQMPYWLRMRVSGGVIVYTIGLALLAAVIVGVVPALKATRRDVRANLQQLAAGGSGMRLGRTWTFLIVTQVAVAVAVLPGAFAGVAAWKRADTAQAKAAARQMLTATLYFDRADLADQRPVGRRSVIGKLATLGSNRTAVVSDADAAAIHGPSRGTLVSSDRRAWRHRRRLRIECARRRGGDAHRGRRCTAGRNDREGAFKLESRASTADTSVPSAFRCSPDAASRRATSVRGHPVCSSIGRSRERCSATRTRSVVAFAQYQRLRGPAQPRHRGRGRKSSGSFRISPSIRDLRCRKSTVRCYRRVTSR